jgi:hypothetical protein
MTNSGVLSNKKNIGMAKDAAGSMQYAAAVGMEATQAYQAQLMAAEMSKLQVYTSLGAPGSYGPGAAAAAAANPAGSVYSNSSMPDQGLRQGMSYVDEGAKEGLLGSARAGILDPEAYANKIMQSSSFRTQSTLVAEAEQLANREGPMYDRLENSIMGVIHEQSAIALRNAIRQERTSQSRSGGTARNATTLDLRRISIMESNMQNRVRMAWEGAKELDGMVRKQIASTQAGSVDFLNNMPGTNVAFMKAMEESAKMAVDASKMSAEIAKSSYEVRQSQQPVNFWVGLAEGLISMGAGWAMGEMDKGGPAGLMKATGEQLNAAADYGKGLWDKATGPEVGRDAQGNLLGPLQSMEGEDNRAMGDIGNKVSSILGWERPSNEWKINRG